MDGADVLAHLGSGAVILALSIDEALGEEAVAPQPVLATTDDGRFPASPLCTEPLTQRDGQTAKRVLACAVDIGGHPADVAVWADQHGIFDDLG